VRRRVLTFLALPVLLGCVHKYSLPQASQPEERLRPGTSAYLVLPADGQDDRPRTYANSGTWTQTALAEALEARGVRVIVGGAEQDTSTAITKANDEAADVLVYPRIVHWSDRMTEWSGIPDRITLRIDVYEVPTGNLINRQEIKASSRWATFGGDHPQEFLPELTRLWAATLTYQ